MNAFVLVANVASFLALLLVIYNSVKALKTRVIVAVDSIKLEASQSEVETTRAQEIQDIETSNAARIKYLLQVWTTFAVILLIEPLEWSYVPYVRALLLVAAAAPSSTTHGWFEHVFEKVAEPVFGAFVPAAMIHVGRVGGVFASAVSPALRKVLSFLMSESVCDKVDVTDVAAHLDALDEAIFTTKKELRRRQLLDMKRSAAHARLSSGESDDSVATAARRTMADDEEDEQQGALSDRSERAGNRGKGRGKASDAKLLAKGISAGVGKSTSVRALGSR